MGSQQQVHYVERPSGSEVELEFCCKGVPKYVEKTVKIINTDVMYIYIYIIYIYIYTYSIQIPIICVFIYINIYTYNSFLYKIQIHI